MHAQFTLMSETKFQMEHSQNLVVDFNIIHERKRKNFIGHFMTTDYEKKDVLQLTLQFNF